MESNKLFFAVFLGLAVLASGCTSTPTEDVDPSEKNVVKENSSSSNTSSVNGSDGNLSKYQSLVRVVDGDTVEIKYEGAEGTVRLLGVDTPEVHKEVEPTDWEGIPANADGRQCLSRYGEKASQYTEDNINNKISFYFDSEADKTGYYGRMLGYIYDIEDGKEVNTSINAQLLENGLATVYESEFSYLEEYRSLENQAQEENVGAWKCREDKNTETNENQEKTGSNTDTTRNTITQNTDNTGETGSSLSLSISDSTPCQYSSVEVDGRALYENGTGLEDAQVRSTWRYKSTDSSESTSTGSDGSFSLSRDIGRASTDYQVDVFVEVEKEDILITDSVSFTPEDCS